MSRQTWEELIWAATQSGTAVTNTTTETIVFPNVTIPANYMQASRVIRIRAQGQWSTGTGPPTLIFGLRWGGVAGVMLCKTAACTLVASVTAAMWDLDIIVRTVTDGATGALLAMGDCRIYAGVAGTVASATGAGLLTPMGVAGVLAPANSAAVDLTADTALSLTATWSASSTSHTLTGLMYGGGSLN